jgi:UDP-N-acetylmuramyl pentapeptide phosphotransferase/UDP-N-acetylglucosamine-1-phosphate transferase
VSVLVGIVVGVVTAWFLRIAGRDMLRLPALERTNYRGVSLPTAGGIVIVLTVLVIEAGRAIAGGAGLGDVPGLTLSRSLDGGSSPTRS